MLLTYVITCQLYHPVARHNKTDKSNVDEVWGAPRHPTPTLITYSVPCSSRADVFRENFYSNRLD